MTEENYNFQSLIPDKNVDITTYENALDYAFNTKEVTNIAISGPYGSGKSSLIETYKDKQNKKKKEEKKNFLHVSLAHFKTTDESLEKNALEGKILNQLIHQLDPKHIPLTDFRIKKEFSQGKAVSEIIFSSLTILFLLYIMLFEQWGFFINDSNLELLNWSTAPLVVILMGVAVFLMIIRLIYLLVKINKERNLFKKISFKGNEIEIFQDNQEQESTGRDSIFDKYLNEVIYLFEHSQMDAIVFEDLDRYDSNQIFAKLREINTLVNNKLNDSKSIHFLYLLRDDIFDSKDRTKFFDFIIPVVPVIDSSNAEDKFIEQFKQGEILDLFKSIFLERISLYIDDMRILKNIYNEFRIYKARLNIIEIEKGQNNEPNEPKHHEQENEDKAIALDNNKLLAIIVYKNIFPKDFNDLQFGRGFVYNLFQNKDKIIEEEILTINYRIKEIKKEIEQENKEVLNSIDELDVLYFLPKNPIVTINGQSVNSFSKLEIIRELKKNFDSANYQVQGNGVVKNFKAEYEKLKKDTEYNSRKERIKKREEDREENLIVEKESLSQRKSLLENGYLRNAITEENIEELFNNIKFKNDNEIDQLDSIKESPYFNLIKFLIRNGYVDETYPDYMTYFYAHTLSPRDKNFMLSVTNQKGKDAFFRLNDPGKVTSKLYLSDFEEPAILNYDLLSYLLQELEYSNELKRFLQQLIDEKNIQFISNYLKHSNTKQNLFIKALTQQWPDFFYVLVNGDNDVGVAIKQEIAKLVLYYSSDDIIHAQNLNAALTDFISKDPYFLNIEDPKTDTLIQKFKMLKIKFKSLDYEFSNNSLFYRVYKENLYELNFNNVCMYLKVIYKLTDEDDLLHRNLSLIYSKPNEPLAENIEQDINKYISEAVLKNSDSEINDDKSIALKVLNHPEVDGENKKAYIENLTTIIPDINEVSDSGLWELLLKKNVDYSTINIMGYFIQTKVIDRTLIDFINSSNESLTAVQNYEFEDEDSSSFFNNYLVCNELTDERYDHLLKKFRRVYKGSFSKEGIEENKMLLIISNSIISMNEDTISFLKERYSSNVLELFIVKYIDDYIESVMNKEDPNLEELVLILTSNRLKDEKKLSLLRNTQKPIRTTNKKYSTKIKAHILNNNLAKDDLPRLIIDYSNEIPRIKKIVEQIAFNNSEVIRDNEYELDPSLLDYLLLSNDLSLDLKKDLLAINLPSMHIELAKKYLDLLEMYDFLKIFEQKRPRFAISDRNYKILTAFRQNDWITQFKKSNEHFYRAFSKKQK